MVGSWSTDWTTMALMIVGLFTALTLQFELINRSKKTNKTQVGLSRKKSTKPDTCCTSVKPGEVEGSEKTCKHVCVLSSVCSMIHYTHRKGGEKKKKECVLCAAMQLSQDHNPRTMWNVSSNCQWLKPTLVEQLQYTVSGRVLSLRIKIKCRP